VASVVIPYFFATDLCDAPEVILLRKTFTCRVNCLQDCYLAHFFLIFICSSMVCTSSGTVVKSALPVIFGSLEQLFSVDETDAQARVIVHDADIKQITADTSSSNLCRCQLVLQK